MIIFWRYLEEEYLHSLHCCYLYYKMSIVYKSYLRKEEMPTGKKNII